MKKNHNVALKVNPRLNQLKALDRRMAVLAATNRSLKQMIARRKTVEAALRKSGGHSKELLEESLRLQEHLRHLAHQIMSAQEDKRKKISHELQDEIAQTLLAINVRLLALKADAVNARCFKKGIASTQRMVERSVSSINRFSREPTTHRKS
jgi:signal transduction histidine kinase